ncbi:MAG: glycosyltransferase family 4 protein [Rivularia sp. (in: cyanobacteria)]
MLNIIIVGNKHLSKPNIPRKSKHHLIYPKEFPVGRYPLSKLWYPFNNLAVWQPTFKKKSVIHAFNSIPYTINPFIITGELFIPFVSIRNNSSLLEKNIYYLLQKRLELDNCKKIILLSDYAKQRFKDKFKNINSSIENKLEIIHPNFPAQTDNYKNLGENLNIIFLGNHFARKGGIVTLRLAKKAHQRGLPLTIHIASKLVIGAGVPTDYPDRARYEEDLELLDLPNVKYYGSLANKDVLKLMAICDFQILPSLEDTYGFSIVEGFSTATPAIATNICALPELVENERTGYTLKLPKTELGSWLGYRQWMNVRDNPSEQILEDYWEMLDKTYEDLAEQAFAKISDFWSNPNRLNIYKSLSQIAFDRFQTFHDSNRIAEKFDDIYSKALL